jgi:hypothetical protein
VRLRARSTQRLTNQLRLALEPDESPPSNRFVFSTGTATFEHSKDGDADTAETAEREAQLRFRPL